MFCRSERAVLPGSSWRRRLKNSSLSAALTPTGQPPKNIHDNGLTRRRRSLYCAPLVTPGAKRLRRTGRRFRSGSATGS